MVTRQQMDISSTSKIVRKNQILLIINIDKTYQKYKNIVIKHCDIDVF